MRVNKKKHTKAFSALLLFLSLVVFWLILSSHVAWEVVIVGMAASCIVVLYNLNLLFDETERTRLSFKGAWAFCVICYRVVIQIVKANFQLVKIILGKRLTIDPKFGEIPQPLTKALNQSLYANAITLTPGTLSIDVDQDRIIVHALKPEYLEELKDGPLEQAFVAYERSDK